jgi:hypothetical protein
MPPVTVHTYQNMRGDFQDPTGMADGERLFPPTNNLSEEGRPFVQGCDGMMLVSNPTDLGWQADRATGSRWGISSRRRARTRWQARTRRRRPSSGRFSRSQDACSRQRRGLCRVEGL